MDTRQLTTLLAISDQGGFAAAAGIVNLSPSAVSQQVFALEQELGVTLFDRNTRPPSLNAKGLQFVEAARAVLQIVNDTKAYISGAQITGTLNIGSLRTGTVSMVPATMVALRESYPLLDFQLHVGMSEALMNDVAAERLDLAVVSEHVSIPRNLRWRPLLREPLMVIAPPGTPHMTPAGWLSEFPYIRYKSAVPLANQIDAEFSRMGLAPKEHAVITTMPAVVECVRAGLGVSVVPLATLDNQSRPPLPQAYFGDPPLYRQVGVVQRRNSARAEVIDAFCSAMRVKAHAIDIATLMPEKFGQNSEIQETAQPERR